MSADEVPLIIPLTIPENYAEQACLVRLITASVYTLLLAEYVASIPEEVEYIWKAPLNFARVMFLLFRYITLGGVTILIHVIAGLSGGLNESFCRHSVATLSALAVFCIGIADAVMVLRVSVLWGRSRVILGLLFTGFLVTYGTAVVCSIIGAIKLVSFTFFIPELYLCLPLVKPYSLLGVWAPGMVFDALVLGLTALNGFARPRKQCTPLSMALFKDGIAFFICIASLRALNLFMTIFAPFYLYLVSTCISWPLSAVALSRLIFHIQRMENETNETSTIREIKEPICESLLVPSPATEEIQTRAPGISDRRTSPTPPHMWEIIEAQALSDRTSSSGHSHGHIGGENRLGAEEFYVQSLSMDIGNDNN